MTLLCFVSASPPVREKRRADAQSRVVFVFSFARNKRAPQIGQHAIA